MNNFNNFLAKNSVLNSIINTPQNNILRTINPQYIQSAANSLWNSANQFVANNLPNYFNFRETVTLLIDISPEDRLFLQHEAQRQLNSILSTNNCNIDLNLSSSLSSLLDSTHASIKGPPNAVLSSYLEIRQLLPITVWFDLNLNPNLQSIILDPSAQPLYDIQKTYDIAICVVPVQTTCAQPMSPNQISIYIRTNRKNEEKLNIGIEELRKYIVSKNYALPPSVLTPIQTKIEVPSNQPTIIGRSYSMLDQISCKTGTQISAQKSATNMMTNVSINGNAFFNVSNARNEISDRFVVELNFCINGCQTKVVENSSRVLERMSEEFAVHILMKPNGSPDNKTMIIRGTDREVFKLFEVRERILQLISNPSKAPALTDSGTAFVCH